MERKTLDKSYTDKYQKHVACSYGVDDKLSNSKSYLLEDTTYSFLIVWLTKVNTVVMWRKYIYQRTCHE